MNMKDLQVGWLYKLSGEAIFASPVNYNIFILLLKKIKFALR